MCCRPLQLVKGLCAFRNAEPRLGQGQAATRSDADVQQFGRRPETFHNGIKEDAPILHGNVVGFVRRWQNRVVFDGSCRVV